MGSGSGGCFVPIGSDTDRPIQSNGCKRRAAPSRAVGGLTGHIRPQASAQVVLVQQKKRYWTELHFGQPWGSWAKISVAIFCFSGALKLIVIMFLHCLKHKMHKNIMNTLLFWVKLNQRDILFRIYYVFLDDEPFLDIK